MARIDHAVISGTFSLDGQTFDVDNNVWVIGDDHRVCGDRRPAQRRPTSCTWSGIARSAPCCARTRTTTTFAWHLTWGERSRHRCCSIRRTCRSGSSPMMIHRTVNSRTDSRSRWPTSLYRSSTPRDTRPVRCASTPRTLGWSSPATPCSAAAQEQLGGPSATTTVIVHSITERLLTLPEETVVKTGHGDDTTIAAERENILAGGGFA